MTRTFRGPDQASRIFGLGTNGAPRPKNLFVVRFRKTNTTSDATSGWQKDLGFYVKSVEKPQITPELIEVNQYNKKRQIQTGYKTQPLRLTIYDTADSLATQMFAEYAKYYFGDFRHDVNDFKWDVNAPQFKDSNGQGFGFAPIKNGQIALDDNSQFFFETIQIFQVQGGNFVQFDLVNPKISSYAPDELTYESSDIGTVSLTIAYEALLFRNDGKPLPLSAEPALAESFQDLRLKGDVYEPPNDSRNGPSSASSATEQLPSQFADINPQASSTPVREYNSSGTSGALAPYGNFDFGWITSDGNAVNSGNRSLAGDLSYRSNFNPSLAAILGASRTLPPGGVDTGLSAFAAQSGISYPAYDVAANALTLAGGPGVGTALIPGTMASAIIAGSSPSDGVRSSDGMILAPQVYGTLNAQRSAISQIGFNRGK